MTYRQSMSAQYNNDMGRSKLLKEISMVDFAIVDLNEYLDTHPDDTDAVAYIKQYITILRRLKEEYASLYGPLNIYDSGFNDNNDWKWARMPLPWEGGCK
ncbi:MAG: spore coat protein CotJB [Lachnospiraceae bacterium]